ncbi:MAG: response regulator [Bacteroidales bacterium]
MEKVKVLLCEDNKLTQRLLEVTLKKLNFDIVVAANGEQGIRFLKEEDIKLIITDINMPYNNGLEIVEFVRKNFNEKIPVIIVSGINLEETQALAAELGADEYFTKPFDPVELVRAVKKLGVCN